MIVCLRTVAVPPEWHERYLAWIADGRAIRQQHGILAELVCEPATPGAEYDHRGNKCTFEVLIDDHDLDSDRALVRLARIVHAADIADDLNTDPAGPGLLAIGLGGLDVEADDQRLLDRGRFVYDALYAWCQRQVTAPA